MSIECSLTTSAYTVRIQFIETYKVPLKLTKNNEGDLTTYVRANIEMSLHPTLGAWSFSTGPVGYMLAHWKLLADYLEKHMLTLFENEDVSATDGFAFLEGTFIARAGDGFVDGTKSIFYLEFQINIGEVKSDDSPYPTFLGGNSPVSTNEVQAFVRQLRAAISELRTSPTELGGSIPKYYQE